MVRKYQNPVKLGCHMLLVDICMTWIRLWSKRVYIVLTYRSYLMGMYVDPTFWDCRYIKYTEIRAVALNEL